MASSLVNTGQQPQPGYRSAAGAIWPTASSRAIRPATSTIWPAAATRLRASSSQLQPGYGQQPQPGYGQQPQPGYGQPAAGSQPGRNARNATALQAAPPADPHSSSIRLPCAAATAILGQLCGGRHSASGAKPVGSPIVGNFQQGQSLQGQLQLSPGKCYTVVGAGVPPVSELNIQLLAVTPFQGMAPLLAQDADVGAQAVLGRKPNCYKWPLPMSAPVNVVLTVAGGSGLAAAQVYEK